MSFESVQKLVNFFIFHIVSQRGDIGKINTIIGQTIPEGIIISIDSLIPIIEEEEIPNISHFFDTYSETSNETSSSIDLTPVRESSDAHPSIETIEVELIDDDDTTKRGHDNDDDDDDTEVTPKKKSKKINSKDSFNDTIPATTEANPKTVEDKTATPETNPRRNRTTKPKGPIGPLLEEWKKKLNTKIDLSKEKLYCDFEKDFDKKDIKSMVDTITKDKNILRNSKLVSLRNSIIQGKKLEFLFGTFEALPDHKRIELGGTWADFLINQFNISKEKLSAISKKRKMWNTLGPYTGFMFLQVNYTEVLGRVSEIDLYLAKNQEEASFWKNAGLDNKLNL